MSILAPRNYSFSFNPQESPKCPSAPKIKPFSSSSTLQDEQDIFKFRDVQEQQPKVNNIEVMRNKKQRKEKKSMLEFLKEKIQMQGAKKER